jgi:hypothetical protein
VCCAKYSAPSRNLRRRPLVAKLKAARDRKRLATGKCGGRRSYREARPNVVALAKELQAGGMSLRKISAELAARGHLTGGGKALRCQRHARGVAAVGGRDGTAELTPAAHRDNGGACFEKCGDFGVIGMLRPTCSGKSIKQSSGFQCGIEATIGRKRAVKTCRLGKRGARYRLPAT